MRLQHALGYCLAGLLSAVLISCGSSKPQSENPSQTTQPVVDQTPKQEQKAPGTVDTVDASMQNTKKPDYQPQDQTQPAAGTTVTYTVQVGAYKMQDNAEKIGSLAKDRFNRGVNVVFDNASGLYKVMIGSFTSKDDARQFRDQMVQQFPADYKDAWVSDVTQK